MASMLREVRARPAFLADWVDRVYSQALESVFASNLELEYVEIIVRVLRLFTHSEFECLNNVIKVLSWKIVKHSF